MEFSTISKNALFIGQWDLKKKSTVALWNSTLQMLWAVTFLFNQKKFTKTYSVETALGKQENKNKSRPMLFFGRDFVLACQVMLLI